MEAYANAHRLPVVLAARTVLLALCLALTAIGDPSGGQIAAAGALVGVAILASLPWPDRVAWGIPLAEGVLAAAVIAGADPLNEALLPYLVVPALGGGLARGFFGALVTVAMSTLVLVGARASEFRGEQGVQDSAAIGQWLVVAVAVGLIAGWARRIQERNADPDVAAYESAYRLLNQLRSVSRQLSVGLDQVTLASTLLDDLLGSLPAQRGVVFATAQDGKFVPLAAQGIRPEVWAPRTADGSAWSRALRTGVGQAQSGGLGLTRHDERAGAVVPVRVGTRTIAIVGVERDGEDFAPADLAVATSWATDYAVRLDTAMLFSEVRSVATSEERRRLAREIHDGVAQELASLGYVIDDLTAQASSPRLKSGLGELRGEVTRIITELRLSIFDLRSEVTEGVSLTGALSEYSRSLGPSFGAEIHLSLKETTSRLRFETEAEVLRIAQEALTNCRRHADAANIWVTCVVEPPHFTLTIKDDGKGMGDGRNDSYGLDIMRERAERIGADFTIDSSDRSGTTVTVSSRRSPSPDEIDTLSDNTVPSLGVSAHGETR